MVFLWNTQSELSPSFLLSFREVLYEDEGFRSRQFAALVASKVFYHLGAFEESLNYALGAGDLFNVNDNSEYVETIIGNSLPPGKALPGQLHAHIQSLVFNLMLPNFISIGKSEYSSNSFLCSLSFDVSSN